MARSTRRRYGETKASARRRWSVSGALALAPDSNINTATSAREIALFGFPATLSEDARETSDVGLTADVAGSHERLDSAAYPGASFPRPSWRRGSCPGASS